MTTSRIATTLLVFSLPVLALLPGCSGEGGGTAGADGGGIIDLPAQCSDGVDNDDDGTIDGFDPGCSGPDDDDERQHQCEDGADNDGDGAVDLDDRGCADADDDDEGDEPPLPACQNGVDDDGDGRIDLDDRGCDGPDDADESGEPPLSACADGEDNDQDTLTDFPADPGCASVEDDSEEGEVTPEPQCGDGIDNDLDGFVDLADPGCETAFDIQERNGAERAVCSNWLDDDGDGLVDFPYDPGCRAAGDTDEEDEARERACGNGLDDDGDGRVDYPDDPGCAGIGDGEEVDPPIPPACGDGRDNDRDGLIDYPQDPGCEAAADTDEEGNCGGTYRALELEPGRVIRGDSRGAINQAEGSCGGRAAGEAVYLYRVDRAIEAFEVTTEHGDTRIETALYVRRGCLEAASEVACTKEPTGDGVFGNRVRVDHPPLGTYYIFLDGAQAAGGIFAVSLEVLPLAECLNAVDDDDDGRVDYPNDQGCESPQDRSEADPPESTACGNDADDDGDGRVDYPVDPGCSSAADQDEVDLCGAGVRALEYPVGQPFILDDTRRGTNGFVGSCGGDMHPELIYRYDNPYTSTIEVSVDFPESVGNTLVYARTECTDARSELDCGVGAEVGANGSIRLVRLAPGPVFLFVDHRAGAGGPFKLGVEVTRLAAGCDDGLDNDEDGFVDLDDVGCADSSDEGEADPAEPPVCLNGVDDDADGLTDYPFDPGCGAAGDIDEANPNPLPACLNGIDDDADGLVDFPADDGCAASGDDDEEIGRPGQCANRRDDDMDGLTDYPFDPGCSALGDLSETDDALAPACSNQRDDDRDGLTDFPFDPGCLAAGHRTEIDPPMRRACSNGIDDDGDGIIDFPREPGCLYAADDDEADPAARPQCSNGRDDDGNGRIDWPDDPGCTFAADNREDASGPTRRRCNDAVDNDLDGLVDLADPGCDRPEDDDEEDPAEAPWCADGVDNDEDGQTDWPDDEGCAARGDACEQAGYGLCDGACLDVQIDTANCGRCGRTCDAGVECINGFCGGLLAFEGIRENVLPQDLEGWEICHLGNYSDGATTIADILMRCDGRYVMEGCRPVNSPTWQLLAMGERDEVFFDTGRAGNEPHPHNGVNFYFNDSRSMGFAPAGEPVQLNSCDVAQSQPTLRMCWHTGGGRLNNGYRCGQWTGGGQGYERAIWTAD